MRLMLCSWGVISRSSVHNSSFLSKMSLPAYFHTRILSRTISGASAKSLHAPILSLLQHVFTSSVRVTNRLFVRLYSELRNLCKHSGRSGGRIRYRFKRKHKPSLTGFESRLNQKFIADLRLSLFF